MDGERTMGAQVPPVALTVAGSDSGGGAGIQADLKTFHAFGVFGTSALTAVTAQNTVGVRAIKAMPPELVAAQIRAVCEDLAPTACKSGMLANAGIIRAVAGALAEHGPPPWVLDPVMVAASGDPLLETDAVEALRDLLLPSATLVTPNLDEAEVLTGRRATRPAELRPVAESLLAAGCRAVLLKGGHLEGDEVVDLFTDGEAWREWRSPRLPVRGPHGTGCTLSAAIAACLALGRSLAEAVETGLAWTRAAISRAPALGAGPPPLDHWTPLPS